MKLLWITNILFPEAQSLLTGGGSLKSSGGWLIGAAQALVSQPDVELVVASLSTLVKSLTRLEGDKITYFVLPYGRGNKHINHDYEPLWKQVKEIVKPDVVHLHGTEFTHGLAYLEACGAEGVCVSIQGFVNAISDYYCAGLSRRDILRSITPYSLFYGGIYSTKKSFSGRAVCEKTIIKSVYHILGRTNWDRAKTWSINPQAHYHYSGETLRKEFYEGSVWSFEKCKPHSVFLSQANSPIKGMHMVLRAMPYVLKHYPDTTIRVAGYDISTCRCIKDVFRISHYGNIIRRLIIKYNLGDRVIFTGPLDAEGMRQEYLNANVFICPSAIENSPNSLGEAQLLGVPVLASYVGGVPDMMIGDEDHLYRFDEVDMLAFKIVELFKQRDNLDTNRIKERAMRRHDALSNISDLIAIYKSIID